MKPTSILLPSFLLLIHSLYTTAYFSLNDTGPYWSYTAQQLTPTTSQKCQTAYSAPIDCPETLLGLATSLRPGFQPTLDELSSLCTLGCKNALEDYVQNVGSECMANGDLAQQQEYRTGQNNTYVRVWIVGQMLEYIYAQSCAKDQSQNFCPLTSTALPSMPANCTSSCSITFYTNVHAFRPASQKQFRHSYLTSQTAYWIQQFNQGYKALVACGATVGNDDARTTKSEKSAEIEGFAEPTTAVDYADGITVAGVTAVPSPTSGASETNVGATSASRTTVAAVFENGNSSGSVLEVDLKTIIALGVLGLIAAAILL